MTPRKLAVLVLITASLGGAAAGSAEEIPPIPSPLSLEWCLESALERSPELAAEAAASSAARHRVVPAGSLDDPRFSYQLVNVPRDDLDLGATPMSGQQLGLAQRLPFPGLLASREGAARAAADSAQSALEDRRQRIASAVERAWAELGFAQRALAITDRNTELLRQLTGVAETKYAVGFGLQQDVLRAQVQLTTLLQQRLRRVSAVRTAEAGLAALLDLPPGAIFPRTAEPVERSPVPDLEALRSRLPHTSPALRAAAARVEEAERLHRAAELEGYPDFDVAVGYRVRRRSPGDPVMGDDFVSASVTIRLPVNRAKWRERVAERSALLRRARAEERAVRAALVDALRAGVAELERADAEVELVERGLLPQARRSLEASRSGYQVDKVDFLSLVNSHVSLLDAELRRVRALADRRIAFARIEAALGESIR